MIRSLLLKYQTPAALNAILMTRYSPFGLLPHHETEKDKKIERIFSEMIKKTNLSPKASSQSKPPP